MKKQGWRNESQRHAMASRGVSSRINIDENSGVWCVSEGVLSEMVTLMQVFGFDSLGSKEAKGYDKETYTADASRLALFPYSKVEQSIKWLRMEWSYATRPRKNQLKNLVKTAIKQISARLPRTRDVDERLELHRALSGYKRFLEIRGVG